MAQGHATALLSSEPLYSEQFSQGAGNMTNKRGLGHLVEQKAPIRPETTDKAGVITTHDQLEVHPRVIPVMLCATGRQGDAGCEMWCMAA